MDRLLFSKSLHGANPGMLQGAFLSTAVRFHEHSGSCRYGPYISTFDVRNKNQVSAELYLDITLENERRGKSLRNFRILCSPNLAHGRACH